MKSCSLLLGLLALVVLVGSGCKAGPAPNAGFIENPGRMVKTKRLPFHRAWAKPGTQWGDYKSIRIAPVNTDYLMKSSWWARMNFKDPQHDCTAIGKAMEEALASSFREDEKKRFQVVDNKGPDTLVLEIALVELVPTKVGLNLVGVGAAFLVTGGGTISSLTKGSIAFEARVRDATSGEVLATFADREKTKFALINLNNLKYYGFTNEVLKEWADQFVAIANLEPGGVVKASKPYKLKPY